MTKPFYAKMLNHGDIPKLYLRDNFITPNSKTRDITMVIDQELRLFDDRSGTISPIFEVPEMSPGMPGYYQYKCWALVPEALPREIVPYKCWVFVPQISIFFLLPAFTHNYYPQQLYWKIVPYKYWAFVQKASPRGNSAV